MSNCWIPMEFQHFWGRGLRQSAHGAQKSVRPAGRNPTSALFRAFCGS
jgi:hypothetical protein